MTAQECYANLMAEVFKFDNNPTYELTAASMVNRYGIEAVNAMEDAGLIVYVGQNSNNYAVYQIR